MSAELTHYIAEFGYAAIFLLVFFQELGVPNPVTNEFVLLFSGYLAFTGVLNFWLVLLTTVAADFIGTSLLYWLFYRFGTRLLVRLPKWLPISPERLKLVTSRISERERWGICGARLLPFLRGYASVVAGTLSIRPGVFLPAVAISAVTWSGGYVLTGRLLGPSWEQLSQRIGAIEGAAVVGTLSIAATFVGRAVLRRRRQPA